MKSVAIVALALGLMANAAEAGTIVGFAGNENGSLATTMAASSLVAGGNSITSMLTNSAPSNVSTVYGFHIGAGNFSGYPGSPDALASPAGVNLDSRDDDLGDVPHSGGTQLDSNMIRSSTLTARSLTSASPSARTRISLVV